MDRFIQYIRDNTVGVVLVGVMILGVVGLTLGSGCTLSDIVKVSVPPAVQATTNTKAVVTLSRAPFVRKQYINQVTDSLAEFDSSIEQASVFRDFAASLLNTGIGAGQGALAGVPGGALLVGAFGTFAGLFLKKPGTDALVNSEKRASFNAGLKKGQTPSA
jgi:hypothetical protein